MLEPLLAQGAYGLVEGVGVGGRGVGRMDGDVEHVEHSFGGFAFERDRVIKGAGEDILDEVSDGAGSFDAGVVTLTGGRESELLPEGRRLLLGESVDGAVNVEVDVHCAAIVVGVSG